MFPTSLCPLIQKEISDVVQRVSQDHISSGRIDEQNVEVPTFEMLKQFFDARKSWKNSSRWMCIRFEGHRGGESVCASRAQPTTNHGADDPFLCVAGRGGLCVLKSSPMNAPRNETSNRSSTCHCLRVGVKSWRRFSLRCVVQPSTN